jgi:hypothetical protein
MNAFDDPHWNLDQVRTWTTTRDPELVRKAALPSSTAMAVNSGLLAMYAVHTQARMKAAGRDIDAELWAMSGSAAPRTPYRLPIVLFRYAKELDVSRVPNSQTEVIMPKMTDNEGDKEIQGPPQIVQRGCFPIEDFLLKCFRNGKLKAFGFLRGESVARELSCKDWAGLTIAVGGDLLRLTVWRNGNRRTVDGPGDIENVCVSRDDVLALFPAEAQKAIVTLDEVLRAAANQSGGKLTQITAEKMAREAGVFTTREELRDTIKRLEIQDKGGRKKTRRAAA